MSLWSSWNSSLSSTWDSVSHLTPWNKPNEHSWTLHYLGMHIAGQTASRNGIQINTMPLRRSQIYFLMHFMDSTHPHQWYKQSVDFSFIFCFDNSWSKCPTLNLGANKPLTCCVQRNQSLKASTFTEDRLNQVSVVNQFDCRKIKDFVSNVCSLWCWRWISW